MDRIFTIYRTKVDIFNYNIIYLFGRGQINRFIQNTRKQNRDFFDNCKCESYIHAQAQPQAKLMHPDRCESMRLKV